MIANHKGEIPVVVLLIPFLLGIGLGINLFPGINPNWLIALFFGLSLLFVVLNFNYNRFNLYKARWIGGFFITLTLSSLGWLTVIRYNELNNKDHFSKLSAQFLVVQINNEPILKNGLLRFTANVKLSVNNRKRSAVSGTLLITVKDSTAKTLRYGDELLIPAKYNPVEPPYVPAEFNYKKYLAGQNVFYQAFLFPKQYVQLASNTGNPIIAYSLRLRQRCIEKFKVNMRDTNAIAVASTLILGYKANLSDDVLQAYSTTGTIHVLSVSGAHVAIIFVLLNLALSFLNSYRYGKLIKAIIIITLIWYYSLLSGFSPAVCRAAVMISMVIIGKTYNRYINTLNILAISAFGLLLYDPFFIVDVGFQLSYLAVFGLIVYQPIVYKWFTFKNKWADKLWAVCSVSLAAQVITFPLSAFYFHQFPVYFLVSNLFIIIPSAVIIYAGIIYLLLPQIPVVSQTIAYILEKSILVMNKALFVIEHAPFASVGKIWITTFEYLLLYVIIISLFYFLYDKKTILLKLSLLCALALCVSLSVKRIRSAQTQNVAFLSLGKHRGLVFKNGNEGVVLSDLKVPDKAFQYTVQPYLDSCRILNPIVLDFKRDIKTSWIIKKYGLVQFLNKRIFIFDGDTRINNLQQKIPTDYLLLTGNQHESIAELSNSFEDYSLILDGNNSDRSISMMKQQAELKHINYRILKRNNSYIPVSN